LKTKNCFWQVVGVYPKLAIGVEIPVPAQCADVEIPKQSQRCTPAACGFGNLVSTVTSLWMPRYKVRFPVTEVAMNKMMLKFPTTFGEAVKQVFVGGRKVASPDLQNLNDRCLADIGLTRGRNNYEATKPFWLA
jgi:hypothetical protein